MLLLWCPSQGFNTNLTTSAPYKNEIAVAFHEQSSRHDMYYLHVGIKLFVQKRWSCFFPGHFLSGMMLHQSFGNFNIKYHNFQMNSRVTQITPEQVFTCPFLHIKGWSKPNRAIITKCKLIRADWSRRWVNSRQFFSEPPLSVVDSQRWLGLDFVDLRLDSTWTKMTCDLTWLDEKWLAYNTATTALHTSPECTSAMPSFK